MSLEQKLHKIISQSPKQKQVARNVQALLLESLGPTLVTNHFHLVFKIPLIGSPTAVTEVYDVIVPVIVHL